MNQTETENVSQVRFSHDHCHNYRLKYYMKKTAMECRRTGSRSGFGIAWTGVIRR